VPTPPRFSQAHGSDIGTDRLSQTIADYPNLVAEWHPTLNGSLTPERVSAGSIRLIWWRCPRARDHVWKAPPSNRRKGVGCPCCANKRVSVTNALSIRRPDIAREWHPTLNGDLRASDVVEASNRKAVWQCPRSPLHHWTAKIADRTSRGSGCPYCAGKRVCADNSLAAKAPATAAMWHPRKNGSLTPADVTPGSSRKVWWLCPKGRDHEWLGSIADRKRHGCPVCTGRKATKTTSLAARYPAIAAEWHPSKNGALSPHDVVPGSNRRVVWRCSKDPSHVWPASVDKRTAGRGCPFCAGRSVGPRPRCTNSLAAEAPELVAEWHPTKNGSLRPDAILAGSCKKVWWKCPAGPDHAWQSTPERRVKRGQGCPFCAGHRVSVTNSLAAVSPGTATLWHPTKNGTKTPHDVTFGSNYVAWWKCAENPRHVWQMPVDCVQGCPYCNRSWTSIENSLARRAPDIAKEWHPTKNGSLRPKDVVPGSNRRVWWACPKGADHEWQAMVRDRTVGGTGCPYCAGKRLSVTNSLAALFPAIAAEWHPTKNAPVTPRDVMPSSKLRFFWRCAAGPDHEWQATLDYRTRQRSGCPYCRGKRLSVTNSLAAKSPRIARFWHPTKNAPLTPWQVFSSDGRTVWWQCDRKHEWQACIMHRVKKGGGCPICTNSSRGRPVTRRRIREIVRLHTEPGRR
jgi:hypothetical protein